MELNKYIFIIGVIVVAPLALVVGYSQDSTSNQQQIDKKIVPKGDTLTEAIDKRFGRPDRITGSGRAFLHYDLSNGDTVTLVVSGDRIVGVEHHMKKQPNRVAGGP